MISLEQQLPGDVLAGIAERMVARRKEQGLTQTELAAKAGVSLGSLKRFEQTHRISLLSLVCIAFALGCEDDFENLFSKKSYASIDEVIKKRKAHERSRETNERS